MHGIHGIKRKNMLERKTTVLLGEIQKAQVEAKRIQRKKESG
jgi:hypothetical protein